MIHSYKNISFYESEIPKDEWCFVEGSLDASKLLSVDIR